MSITEVGAPPLRKIRGMIELLRDRQAFVEERVKVLPEERSGRDRGEVQALEFAISLMEAEWGNLARIQRNLDAAHHVPKGEPWPEWEEP